MVNDCLIVVTSSEQYFSNIDRLIFA